MENHLNPYPLLNSQPHTPIDIHEIFIKPVIENLTQNYDTQNNFPAIQLEESKLSLDKASPDDISRLEQKLISLPELPPDKIITSQKNDTFCSNTYIATQTKITSKTTWAFYTKSHRF